ncbi:MAG: VirB8/TrbF family protein [Bryobacteraceae bacterium]
MNFTLMPKEKRRDVPLSEYNPYLAARREWDERYGDQITRAKNWRTMATLSALVALLATSGVVWLSVRSHVIPFVVLVDSLSRPVASGIAEQASGTDDRLKRASVFTWVENLRLVTTDGVSQRKAIDRVYAAIANGTAAQTFVSDFYRADPPAKRAQTETVSVEVTSVLPTSDRSYEVEWTETTRDLYGAVKSTERWKGSFSVVINPPRDERQARVNPVGLYVTNASWARVFQEK